MHAAEVGRDLRGDLTAVTRPITRQGGQAAECQGDKLAFGSARQNLAVSVGQISNDREPMDFVRRWAHIRGPAGEDLAQNRAQAEYVGSFIDSIGLASGLFGCHVGRRAQDRAQPRDIDAGIVTNRLDTLFGTWLRWNGFVRRDGLEHLGQAPVHDLHFTEAADHDVAGLEITVNDTTRMRVSDRLAHLLENSQEPRPVVAQVCARFEQTGQRAAPDEFHREVRPLVLEHSQLVHGDDAWVLKLTADLSLLDEPAD